MLAGNKKNRLLAIVGPTATGKTDLGIELAKKIDAELLVCDSRQVYKGLDIGTGKMPGGENSHPPLRGPAVVRRKHSGCWEIDGVKIWGYDLVNPGVRFTVKDYVDFADKKVTEILKRGKKVIIVGGTGLYLRAFLEDLSSIDLPFNEKLRVKLEGLSLLELQENLKGESVETWQEMNPSDRANSRRLIRKIEIVSAYPYVNTRNKELGKRRQFKALKIGLMTDRQTLNRRIDDRLDARIKQGLIEEGRRLYGEGLSYKRMRELGLEYGMLADLLEGKVLEIEFRQRLQAKIHQYAKRQMTWFIKDKDIHWFDIGQVGWREKVAKLASDWYNK